MLSQPELSQRKPGSAAVNKETNGVTTYDHYDRSHEHLHSQPHTRSHSHLLNPFAAHSMPRVTNLAPLPKPTPTLFSPPSKAAATAAPTSPSSASSPTSPSPPLRASQASTATSLRL
ncbi:hypothetical protein CF335_g7832 [Tilletia laevis]|nr:hypothetical protein CF335_g7832 [Tilletia laevis]